MCFKYTPKGLVFLKKSSTIFYSSIILTNIAAINLEHTEVLPTALRKLTTSHLSTPSWLVYSTCLPEMQGRRPRPRSFPP